MAEGPLLLESFYALVDKAPDRVQFTQPFGGGQTRDYTRKQVLDEAMRMAAYLKAQGFEPGSRIGMLSKNCAEFIIAELAACGRVVPNGSGKIVLGREVR